MIPLRRGRIVLAERALCKRLELLHQDKIAAGNFLAIDRDLEGVNRA